MLDKDFSSGMRKRSEQIKGVYLPPEDQGSAPFGTRLAAFPEASRQSSDGHWMAKDAEDTLPPPSAHEIEENALIMKNYNDIVERLRTTGYDDELRNGYRPKIYDLTGGPGRQRAERTKSGRYGIGSSWHGWSTRWRG